MLERLLRLWNGEAVDPATVYAPGCVEDGTSTFDPEDVVPQIAALRGGSSDLWFTAEEWFGDGHRYTVRLRAGGTHDGTLPTGLGLAPATGQEFVIRGVEAFTVEDDRVVAVWTGWNWGDLYEKLGARLPETD